MPNVSFTQYRNELARVLGTHQRPSKSVLSKSVLATSEGTKSEEEEKAVSKSQGKRDKKINALNLLRLGIFKLSWMGQLLKICRFGNC